MIPGEYLPPVVTRLTGDIDDLIKKVEEAKAAIKSLGGTTVKVGFDIDNASLARAQAAAKTAFANGVTMPVRFDLQGAGRALAGGAAFGAVGALIGLAGRGLSLFGGVLGTGILGSVGAIHLLVDGIAEILAVVLPATIALIAFGVAASDAVKNIINQFSAIHTVMDATGQVIPPMTDAMEKLHQAVQPQVYSVLGDALTVVNNKAGEFATVAKGAADAVSYFAARTTVALTSSGLSTFMRNAVKDLSGIFNVFGNIAGTIGAILKNLPGYAETFLSILQSITHGIEIFANSGVGQGLIRFGLAFHGAFIYLGLLGTLVARVMPVIIGWFAKLTYAAARSAEAMGLDSIAAGLFRVGGAAEVAAAGPWGWIGVAAVAIGILAYKIATAKDATQQFTAVMQQTLMNKSAGLPLLNQLVNDQMGTYGRLAQATVHAAQVQTQVNKAVQAGGPGVRYAVQVGQEATQTTNDLTSRQKQLSDETNLYNYRLGILAKRYGGTTEAQNLLTAAGVKGSQMLDKSSQAWKIIQQMVSGVVQGYAAMAQRGGVLGADLFVLTQQASDQYKAMQQLNQAWQTFIGTISQFDASAITVMQTVRTMSGELKKAGASFTGVNANSLTLQATFQQTFVPQLQSVIAGMKQAHDSAATMANFIATSLVKAVNNGALANKTMRTEIYDMAREADPNATNSIAFLKSWVDRNATSFAKMEANVNRTGAALGHLPKNEALQVKLTGIGTWALSGGEGPGGTGIGSHLFQRHAKGGLIRGGIPGRDSVLGLLKPGEVVVPTEMVSAGAVDHLRGRLPGFAAGGLIPNYSGNVGGLGPWAQHDYSASVNIFGSSLAKSFMGAMSSMGGPGGGRASAGGSYNRNMLMNLWQQAGGPGGYIALIAAAIALAESGGNPLAVGPGTPYGHAEGLWQILGQVVGGNIFNPFTNALNAVSKFDSAHGFSPWTTYTSGAYRAFMDRGGWLPPGDTLVTNHTGKPELVTPADQLGGGDIIIQIDGQTVFRVMQKHARRFNRRNGPKGSNKAFLPG